MSQSGSNGGARRSGEPPGQSPNYGGDGSGGSVPFRNCYTEQVVFPVDPLTQEAARIAADLSRQRRDLAPAPFQQAARQIATDLSDRLRAPHVQTDIAKAEALIAKLAGATRLQVFFGAGESSLAGQALAQFAGWNIPGVGEIEQQKRPRTRIYNTYDPDTMQQVARSLDFDRTALVFTPDRLTAETTLFQAMTFIPAMVDAIGADRTSRQIACVVSGRDRLGPNDPALVLQKQIAELVSDQGGVVVELADPAGPLSAAGLLPGLARGIDMATFHAGALAVCDAVAQGRDPASEMHLGWSALVGAIRGHDRRCDRPTHITLATTSDRLARAMAWAAAFGHDPQSQVLVSAVPQAMLGYGNAGLGIDLSVGALVRSDRRDRGPLPGPLLSLYDVGYSADVPFAAEAAAWSDRLVANAVAQGRIVRRVVLQQNSLEAYGRFVGRVILDRSLNVAAIAAAD